MTFLSPPIPPSTLQAQPEGGKQPALEEVAPKAAETVVGSLEQIWINFLAHTPYIVASAIVLLATCLLVVLLRRFGSLLFRRTTPRKSLQALFVRLLSILVWILGLLFAAMVLFPGLTPAKALGAVGLLSVAIGLAFKDIFENFFAGILILWRFPFEEGDVIECESITGRVESVEVRNTTIRKTSGELVVVPNLFLFKNPCKILTNRVRRRITVTVSVGYGEDLSGAVEVIEKALTACETVREDEPVQVFPESFGDSGIDIEVTWWTGSAPLAVRQSRGEVIIAVKKALDEAGIEIPFPYRTLTFSEPLSLKNGTDGPAAD